MWSWSTNWPKLQHLRHWGFTYMVMTKIIAQRNPHVQTTKPNWMLLLTVVYESTVVEFQKPLFGSVEYFIPTVDESTRKPDNIFSTFIKRLLRLIVICNPNLPSHRLIGSDWANWNMWTQNVFLCEKLKYTELTKILLPSNQTTRHFGKSCDIVWASTEHQSKNVDFFWHLKSATEKDGQKIHSNPHSVASCFTSDIIASICRHLISFRPLMTCLPERCELTVSAVSHNNLTPSDSFIQRQSKNTGCRGCSLWCHNWHLNVARFECYSQSSTISPCAKISVIICTRSCWLWVFILLLMVSKMIQAEKEEQMDSKPRPPTPPSAKGLTGSTNPMVTGQSQWLYRRQWVTQTECN